MKTNQESQNSTTLAVEMFQGDFKFKGSQTFGTNLACLPRLPCLWGNGSLPRVVLELAEMTCHKLEQNNLLNVLSVITLRCTGQCPEVKSP